MATNALGLNGIPGGMQDPLQGYDIKVTTCNASGDPNSRLVGAFTSLMFKIVNQTETYLPLNSRIPRMLDGEIIVVWSLEQGMVELNVVTNTFGQPFAAGFEKGRGGIIPRSQRFNILFQANAMIDSTNNNVDMFYVDTGTGGTSGVLGSTGTAGLTAANVSGANALKYAIFSCRVDTFSFGVAAGRHVVANAWQGTGEAIKQWPGTTAQVSNA